MSGGWQVGIDVGGTFTDVVAHRSGDGEVRAAKVRTDARDRVAGLRAALAAVGIAWRDVDDLIHGTTMVTNAIIEDKLAPVALIATEGFADTLEIGRQNRRHLYRLDLPPRVSPQVPPERRIEVRERLDHKGEVLVELDGGSVAAAVRAAVDSGAEAVAVSLLHSYANPVHEEALGDRLRGKFAHVALSSRVNPEAREYERTATTVLSASVMPLAAGHLKELEQARPAGSRLHLFHSAGGMAAPEALADLPLGLVQSGPAAGVAAAAHIAGQLGIGHAISFDMGGTTTDVCLITDGQAEIDSDRELNGRPLRQAMVAVHSIGAGGGSIAALDHGTLRVGPQSAGADPGPACYRRGGELPTVTDANLLLGYMDARRKLGGEIMPDPKAAEAALRPLAGSMNMALEETARGIVRVANAAMTRALGRITVERGIDGRNCTLIAFGGAGPMHAVEVARAFGISRVVVPVHSGAFSALGCVSAGKSYSRQRTVRMKSGDWDAGRLTALRESLYATLAAPLLAAGHGADELATEAVAAIRYDGQSYAVEIARPALDDPPALGAAFRALHERLYGFATDEPWELVALRLCVSVPRDRAVPGVRPGPDKAGPVGTSDCVFDTSGPMPTPRHARDSLAAGRTIDGPAIVEDSWSTVVLPPGASLTPDEAGHLHIDAGSAP
jgi:N-methylhydantoinase A